MKTISLRDSKEVLIYKKTKDSDLSIGLEVCYKNIDGIYCNLGTITDIYQQDGVNLYALNTAMGSYMADELKLVRTTLVNTFEDLRKQVSETKNFVEITEDLFYYALGAVPPIYLNNGTWQMGECYSGNLYYTFGKRDGKYYGCLCNANFSINNF